MILRYHSVCHFKEPSVSNIHTGDEGFFVWMSFESLTVWHKCEITIHDFDTIYKCSTYNLQESAFWLLQAFKCNLETMRCAVQLHWFEFTGKCLESATRERWPSLPFVFFFGSVLYLCKYVYIWETERGIVPLHCINDVL